MERLYVFLLLHSLYTLYFYFFLPFFAVEIGLGGVTHSQLKVLSSSFLRLITVTLPG